MAAGEYISMTAQSELMQRELSRERREQRENPELEEEELASIYQSRGLDPESARNVAEQVMQDPDVAVEVHAREEMGIDPDQLGAPGLAAVSSFGAFAVGAIIPLVPWFFLEDTAAVVTSIVLAAITALTIGAIIGMMTERSPVFSAVRQLTIGAIAGAVTYGVGIILGVQVT
jgi:VIT1/CCC1 family predicted Fe2+/Mn2+ transporter